MNRRHVFANFGAAIICASATSVSALAQGRNEISIIEKSSNRTGSFNVEKDVSVELFDEKGTLLEVLPVVSKQRYSKTAPETFAVYTGKDYAVVLDSNENYSVHPPFASPARLGNYGEALLRMGSNAWNEKHALRRFTQAEEYFRDAGDRIGVQKAESAIATVGSLPFKENREKLIEVHKGLVEYFATIGDLEQLKLTRKALDILQANQY